MSIKQTAKSYVKNHKRLLKLARKLTGKDRKEPPQHVYNYLETFVLADDWAYKLPRKYDCIIAVPRAGISIAQIISHIHNVPLSTTDLFLRGEFWYTRFISKTNPVPSPELAKIKSVLLIEDCIHMGRELRKAKQAIQAQYPNLEVETGALFVYKEGKTFLDHYYSEINGRFLWDLIKGGDQLGPIASDLDGVICEDCPPEMDDDGEKYAQFINSATPKIVPKFELAAIVTSRREKYRDETEFWLNSQGVKYRKLVMFPNEGPRKTHLCAQFKAESAKKVGASWFWESDIFTAKLINKISGLTVMCVDDMTIRH